VDSLDLLNGAIAPHLGEPERGHLAPYLAGGVAAAGEPPRDEAGCPATEGLALTRELFLQAFSSLPACERSSGASARGSSPAARPSPGQR
jgi:hypothetical protein